MPQTPREQADKLLQDLLNCARKIRGVDSEEVKKDLNEIKQKIGTSDNPLT